MKVYKVNEKLSAGYLRDLDQRIDPQKRRNHMFSQSLEPKYLFQKQYIKQKEKKIRLEIYHFLGFRDLSQILIFCDTYFTRGLTNSKSLMWWLNFPCIMIGIMQVNVLISNIYLHSTQNVFQMCLTFCCRFLLNAVFVMYGRYVPFQDSIFAFFAGGGEHRASVFKDSWDQQGPRSESHFCKEQSPVESNTFFCKYRMNGVT